MAHLPLALFLEARKVALIFISVMKAETTARRCLAVVTEPGRYARPCHTGSPGAEKEDVHPSLPQLVHALHSRPARVAKLTGARRHGTVQIN